MYAFQNKTCSSVKMQKDNFYYTIKPFLKRCKILGIVPYTFKNDQVQVSKYNIFYTLLIVILQLTSASEILWVPADESESRLITSIELLHTLATSLQVITIYINTEAKKQVFVDLLHAFTENGDELRRLNPLFTHQTLKNNLRINSALRIFNVVLGMALIIYEFRKNSNWHFQILTLLHYIFPPLLNSMLSYFAFIHVVALNRQFSALNKALEERAKMNTMGRRVVPLRIAWENRFSIPLNKICWMHLHLCKAIALWNKAFGYALVMNFSVSFVAILVGLYSCYLGLNLQEWDVVAASVAICEVYILDVILLCCMCESTTAEARKSGKLIHKIDSTQHSTKNEIEMFSLQIASVNAEFSAAGILSINNSLLLSVSNVM